METEKTLMDAYRAGYNDGEKHVAPSGQTLNLINATNKEIGEMRKEWDELKQRVFALLIAAVAVAAGYGIWVGSMQVTINNNKDNIAETAEELHSLGIESQTSKVAIAEILTKLANIETILVEIKNNK